MSDEIRTWNEILTLAKEVEWAAAEAWAEELDGMDMSKDANQGPFEDLFGVNDYWAEDFENSFQWIRDYMLEAASANPELLDPIISQLDTTASYFDTDKVQDIKGDIADRTINWQGDGAISFRNFIDPTWEAAANQQALINALQVNLASYRKLLVKAREDVYEIGQEAKSAFESIAWGSSLGESHVLTVINLIKTGTLTAIEVTSKPLSVGIALADGVWTEIKGSIASKAEKGDDEDDPSKKYDIGGGTVGDICDSLRTALSDIKSTVDEKEQTIAEKLQEAYDAIEAEGRDSFEAPRPSIADAPVKELTSMEEGFGWHD